MEKRVNDSEALVAYLDLLGYSDLVCKKEDANIYYDAIKTAISRWHQFLNKHEYNIGEVVKSNISLKVVSDTFVIVLNHQKVLSEMNDDSNAMRSIVLMIFSVLVSFLVQDCMRTTELLFRGAIVKGPYYYRDFENLEGSSFIFSKTFCDAVNLEKNIADVPRILFDRSALEEIDDISILLFKKHRPDGVLLRDKDGLYHLNIYASIFSHEALVSILKDIVIILEKNIKNNKSLNILRKYIWFANYHNDLVQGIIESKSAFSDFKEIKDNQPSILIKIPKKHNEKTRAKRDTLLN